MIPAGFFILAGVASLILQKAASLPQIIALFMVAVVFEVAWGQLPGERPSIVGFVVNVVSAALGIIAASFLTGSSML